MPKISPTLKVLMEIRDELKEHRAILREHGERLKEHGELLKDHSGRLGAIETRQVESEVRLATELVGVARAVNEVRDLLRERLDDRDRIDSLEHRVSRLEAHAQPAE